MTKVEPKNSLLNHETRLMLTSNGLCTASPVMSAAKNIKNKKYLCRLAPSCPGTSFLIF